MAKAGEISGNISPVNDYSVNRNFYYPPLKQKPKKQIASPLHKGEIVQATILSDAVNSVARVRLPVGTFDAHIHNKLKKGDKLFFKVIDDKSMLTLRVYSVNTVENGNKIPVNEILRMLDLPENELDQEVVKILSDQNSTVIKDSVLEILKNFRLLTEETLLKKSLLSVIKTIYWMDEANIEFTKKHFEIIYPYYQGLTYFGNLMGEFSSLIHNSGSIELNNTKKILDLCNSEIEFNFFAGFFSKHINNNLLFYNNLKSLPIKNSVPFIIKEKALKIIEIIDSMHKWNSIADISNVPYQLYMPLPIRNDNVIYAQLIIQNYNTTEFNGKIAIDGNDPDCDVGAKINRLNKENLYIDITNSENMENELIDLATKTRNLLLPFNLSLQAFIVNFNNKERDFLPAFPKSPSRKISVVI